MVVVVELVLWFLIKMDEFLLAEEDDEDEEV
jgi:hypothetical protein